MCELVDCSFSTFIKHYSTPRMFFFYHCYDNVITNSTMAKAGTMKAAPSNAGMTQAVPPPHRAVLLYAIHSRESFEVRSANIVDW
jgi:hypothetical protein